MMDKDAFINRVRGYQDLAERMRAVAASKNANLSDAVSYTHLDVYKRQGLQRHSVFRQKNYSVRTVESACFSRIITERKENLIPLLMQKWPSFDP